MIKMYFILEMIGTVAFAISGAMAGIRAKMNYLGIAVLSVTAACGGGITRDILIGKHPPATFVDPVYILTAAATGLLFCIPAVRRRLNTDGWLYYIADAIGLGLFTVVGVEAGMPFDNPFLAQFLGVVTGVGGGVLRDVFANERPAIFMEGCYALSSIIGALCCVFLMPYNEYAAVFVGAWVVIIFRILARKYSWYQPKR